MTIYRVLAITVAVVLLQHDARADADSLNDGLGPREISVGESMRADARGALATTLNPAGLALNRELVFEGSYGYRPGDDFTHLGFPVSPDIDTLIYTLSGTCNTETGWGRSGESWH